MEVTGEIPRYNSIGKLERIAAMAAMREPLSGYLGGEERGGFWVQSLEEKWAENFGAIHAIACNSATSGLCAAAAAIRLGPRSKFVVSPLTMSATCAAPALLGAEPFFVDIDDETFCLAGNDLPYDMPVVATNLFGHPADLRSIRGWCDLNKTFLIEDNAQAPMAMENGRYTGTVGHIGVFSLNVHKHFQAGEGGICVTNSDELAMRMRLFINHSELCVKQLGLNLRMTEVTAAIAYAQLARAPELVRARIDQADRILAAIGDIPGLRKPVVRAECRHVYYIIPFLVDDKRPEIVAALRAEGVPLSEGYQPVNRLLAFSRSLGKTPVTDDLHDRRLFYFENCAWSPTPDQIKQIGNAFQKVFSRD